MRSGKGGVVFWKLNLMECVERTKLINKSVSNRNQGICVVG